MRSRFLNYCAPLLLLVPSSVHGKRKVEYKNADGTRVVILPIGEPPGHESYESRIEFYTSEGQMLCSLDYSSEDGELGFGVVKAAWTPDPDNHFFVFSLTARAAISHGTHQHCFLVPEKKQFSASIALLRPPAYPKVNSLLKRRTLS